MESDNRIREAIERTEIIRAPRQNLYSFGMTSIYYYILTEPAYSDPDKAVTETVIREGKVTAQRPKIVTPYYLNNLEGFSAEARKYFASLIEEYGPDVRGLYYTYRNEPKDSNIVSDKLGAIVDRINADLDRKNDPLTAIIKGEDILWDVSLFKFIYEITSRSAPDNLRQMERRGLLSMDQGGIPADARAHIEYLFRQVARGESEPGVLKDELQRWGLFEEYQDRFLDIFKKRR
jgi:hypothetical protein